MSDALKCLGMPSGHTEVVTIIATLLMAYNIISKIVYLLLIVLIGFQRIYSSRHTFAQVIVGFIMGTLYSAIYLVYFNKYCSYTCISVLLIPLLIIILYITVLIICIDNKVLYASIPQWVDPKLYPIIKKKQNVSYLNKILNFLYFIITYTLSSDKITYFCSWKKLENILDNLIVTLNGESFDLIIGIKSGGAIISNYLATKMKLPNYYIKIQQSQYNCDKKGTNELYANVDKYIQGNKQKYLVCEGIEDDICGKKILLVDETISSGTTIFESEQYLINKKNILPENITVATICINSKKSLSYINTHDHNDIIDKAILPSNVDTYIIWPWGYDN